MAFDGNGTFNLLYTWATEAASPPIAISKLDTEMAGIAVGLSTCLLRSGGGLTGPLSISTSSSHLTLYETGGADPADRALVELDGGLMRLLAYDSSATTWRYFVSGNVSTGAVSAYGAWTFDGSVTIGAQAVATHTSGSFTMELATEFSGGSVLASGTAYWKRTGNIITMRCPRLIATTTDADPWLRGIPAACIPDITGTNFDQGIAVPGVVNGVAGVVEIQVLEGFAYWRLTGLTAAFTGGSTQKGIGVAAGCGPTFSYHVAD